MVLTPVSSRTGLFLKIWIVIRAALKAYWATFKPWIIRIVVIGTAVV